MTAPNKESGSFPFFRQSAQELSTKLDRVGTPMALLLSKEMNRYEATFIAWEGNRPSSEDRSKVISDYLSKVREVQDFLAQHPSKPP